MQEFCHDIDAGCQHADKPEKSAKEVEAEDTTAKDDIEWDLDADLYTVLGLGHVSYNATPAQIKTVRPSLNVHYKITVICHSEVSLETSWNFA